MNIKLEDLIYERHIRILYSDLFDKYDFPRPNLEIEIISPYRTYVTVLQIMEHINIRKNLKNEKC